MPRWTAREDEYLAAHAAEGAASVAAALGRSVPSVQSHASRIGVSLTKRYHCPRCGRFSYLPLSVRTGWCRKCSVEASADSAAERNREMWEEVAREKAAVEREEKRRQALYADTARKKKELAKLRRNRELCKRNANLESSRGDAGEG